MGKLQDRKAALVERIQKVRSTKILDAVEQALTGEVEPKLTDVEYAEMQAIRARFISGEDPGKPWSVIKARLKRQLRS